MTWVPVTILAAFLVLTLLACRRGRKLRCDHPWAWLDEIKYYDVIVRGYRHTQQVSKQKCRCGQVFIRLSSWHYDRHLWDLDLGERQVLEWVRELSGHPCQVTCVGRHSCGQLPA